MVETGQQNHQTKAAKGLVTTVRGGFDFVGLQVAGR